MTRFKRLMIYLFPSKFYKCVPCKDTGFISSEVWVGVKGYRQLNFCRKCRPPTLLPPFKLAKHQEEERLKGNEPKHP